MRSRALQELRRLHPRNRLVVLESGATALRAGRPEQAEDLLTEGLTMLAADTRARIPGEEALWRYKRGAARVARGRLDPAVEDLRVAVAPDAAVWVQGRAHVELGRVARARGDATGGGGGSRTGDYALRAGPRSGLCERRATIAEECQWPVG